MAKLYITEYSQEGRDKIGNAMPIALEPGVDQAPVAISGSSAQSAAFASTTKMIRVTTDVICSIVFGDNPSATANNKRMAADTVEYFGVQAAQKLAVISNT